MFSGQLFQQKRNDSFRFHMNQPLVTNEIAKKIYSFLPDDPSRDIVLVCIGTDRSTGDSLGPLIGSKLNERRCMIPIYGTLNNPVHAKNLVETMEKIESTYNNPFIIGIDACLGRSSSVGYITVANGPVRPGAAVKKQLPEVGNIHITGIVNVNGFMEMMVLQNTRLSLVMDMAEIISRSIARCNRWRETQPNWLLASLQREKTI
ncbi:MULTISPECIES: spore protease YyaC [Bacillaceae]|uniref:Spore protease YyaC n=1 Tax=Evansella alkalicola TaxID=745819 RepID=A0ABS6JYZ9_9BACI|nr:MULTISPECIES: spore protease YyaC [Bacillaceae]MBU9722310.1 spore protease YyaC [Bacillus alkalicola]